MASTGIVKKSTCAKMLSDGMNNPLPSDPLRPHLLLPDPENDQTWTRATMLFSLGNANQVPCFLLFIATRGA